MKYAVLSFAAALLVSCSTTMKLDIPARFSEQADMLEVKGSRSRHVSFGKYSTSKIRRGWHTRSSHYGKGFFGENLLLNQFGIRKNEVVTKEKDKFSFNLSDGQASVQVYAQEFRGDKTLNYQFGPGGGLFDSYNRLQQYQYLLSATIMTSEKAAPWQLALGNGYDRKKDTVNSIFTAIDNADYGIVTDGKDSIEIRPLNIQKAVGPGGKPATIPVKLLTGYELRMDDGVAAIVDNIGKNIWFYKELDDSTRLLLGAIATTILVKRVKDVKW